ncbi:hypothetical protein [Methanimicrococcus hongohii]|uniref:hypothetical protein n=1 Tax=Methanimicrococcus hongohii TaxID=3028295 RepID=UPI00293024BC|nr:hypothetical protein [Methanimicrococcus sp. Hf6]
MQLSFAVVAAWRSLLPLASDLFKKIRSHSRTCCRNLQVFISAADQVSVSAANQVSASAAGQVCISAGNPMPRASRFTFLLFFKLVPHFCLFSTSPSDLNQIINVNYLTGALFITINNDKPCKSL